MLDGRQGDLHLVDEVSEDDFGISSGVNVEAASIPVADTGGDEEWIGMGVLDHRVVWVADDIFLPVLEVEDFPLVAFA